VGSFALTPWARQGRKGKKEKGVCSREVEKKKKEGVGFKSKGETKRR
jgi:hypothetical protein